MDIENDRKCGRSLFLCCAALFSARFFVSLHQVGVVDGALAADTFRADAAGDEVRFS